MCGPPARPSVMYRQRLNCLADLHAVASTKRQVRGNSTTIDQLTVQLLTAGPVGVRLRMDDRHVQPLGSSAFRENRHSDSHILIWSVN